MGRPIAIMGVGFWKKLYNPYRVSDGFSGSSEIITLSSILSSTKDHLSGKGDSIDDKAPLSSFIALFIVDSALLASLRSPFSIALLKVP